MANGKRLRISSRLHDITPWKFYQVHWIPATSNENLGTILYAFHNYNRWYILLRIGYTETTSNSKDFELFWQCQCLQFVEQIRKKLKCGASITPGHMEFWREARECLNHMYFVKVDSNKLEFPSLKSWISTLCGLEELLKSLKDFYFHFLLTLNINQDPIEIFLPDTTAWW